MIHVDFKDFNEMAEFARQLLGGQARKVPEVPEAPAVQPVPTAPVVQATPVPMQAAAVPTAPVVTAPAAAAPATPAQPAAAVPTAQSSYTLDDLARAGMTLMDSGRQEDLFQLLARFGVDALPALPQAQYGAFATALREMGAQI